MRSLTISPSPADAEGMRLYQALDSSAPTTTTDFACAYLPHLTEWLQATNRHVSADLCEEAAVETMYSLLDDPTRFDPSRGKSLLGFLRLSARRDLLNLLRREHRHQHDGLDGNAVELTSSAGKYTGRVKGPLQLLCEQEDEEERQRLLEKVRAISNEMEQMVLDLMLDGVRENEVYARVMAITHLPFKEQRKHVKRVKDRINKRVERERLRGRA